MILGRKRINGERSRDRQSTRWHNSLVLIKRLFWQSTTVQREREGEREREREREREIAACRRGFQTTVDGHSLA